MNKFKKYLLLSLIFGLINAVILIIFFVPRYNYTDTGEYVATIKYILGNSEGKLFLSRITKPLTLLIGVILSPILNPEGALIVQNLIFYFFSVYFIYFLIYRLYLNEKQAFYGAVLFVSAYPMLAYGLAPLTDLPGWFFYLLSIWLSLKFIKNPDFKKALLIGSVGGIGMLFKENSAAIPIFFATLIFMTNFFPIKEKIKYLLIFAVAFFSIPLLSSLIIFRLFSYSLLDWFFGVWKSTGGGFVYSFQRTVIEIGRVLIFGWLFVFFGILKEFKQKKIEHLKLLFAFVPASLSFLFWPFLHNRIMFIAAPLLILLASFGLIQENKNSKVNRFSEIILLFLYISINYFFLDFLLKHGLILSLLF